MKQTNAAIPHLSKEVRDKKGTKKLEKAYMALSMAYADLENRYKAQQQRKQKQIQAMEDLRTETNKTREKMARDIRNQAALFKKYKKDLAQQLDDILAIIDNVKQGGLDIVQQEKIEVMESSINGMLSMVQKQEHDLTPRELIVASLIKQGKKTKEIAEMMGCHPKTITKYRNCIRKKLGLPPGKKVHLKPHLITLDL